MPVTLQQYVIDEFTRVDADGARAGSNAVLRTRVVVRRVAQNEQCFEIRNDVFEEWMRVHRLLGQQPPAVVRVAHASHLCGQRQSGNFREAGIQCKGMQRQFEPQQTTGRSGNDLAFDRQAIALRLIEIIQGLPPCPGLMRGLHEREGHRPAGCHRDLAQQIETRGCVDVIVRHHLKHTSAGIAQAGRQGKNLAFLAAD